MLPKLEQSNLTNLVIIVFCRAKIADAKNNGEQCSTSRILELEETDTCNVIDCPPSMANFIKAT